jgi:selenobiotic family peptide radical SAM maturase
MSSSKQNEIEEKYPVCRSIMGFENWNRLFDKGADALSPEVFPDQLALRMDGAAIPAFMPELARLEWKLNSLVSINGAMAQAIEHLSVNPTVELLALSWKNLPPIFNLQSDQLAATPEPGEELVFIWRHPLTGAAVVQAASEEDLLVLKMMIEGIAPEEAARSGKAAIGVIDAAVDRAVHKGILMRPRPLLRRDPAFFPSANEGKEEFLISSVFTLQWHITQACDLHCKHCYDRSRRSPLELQKGLSILDDLRTFCRTKRVRGHVSFTGGNPFLYPHFYQLYRGAAERGLDTAILGNPVSPEEIRELIAIRVPAFFQVSLEGLPEHNDSIRGSGHFGRVMDFLESLRDLGIYAMVMLTLTNDNINQVLPLAEILRDRVDSFTFNRLSPVGEGANLHLPSAAAYAAFLESYLDAEKQNRILSLKDNLLNILHYQNGRDLFGGCTGFGCGAAFNFMALLPDGEVHACRKFPSLIGNAFERPLSEIYDSERAQAYRTGSAACRNCLIRPVCGGCLAVVHGCGLDVFKDRDPYCFLDRFPSQAPA